MAAFPALEVLTAAGHGLAVGTRVPLTKLPFVIGRPRDNPIAIQSGVVSKRHCEIVFEYERWWVRDLGSTNGTWHLGERVHDAELLHGDVFEVPWGVCFRLLLREPIEVRDADMERAIIEQPDDDERWAVYADWLQEQGAPLGERLANPNAADDRRWLGVLACFAGRGEMHVEWAHGLPSRVVMRCLGTWRSEVSWEFRLATLLRTSQFRFLRSLEIDVGSFLRESSRARWGKRLLQAIGPEALPLLERVAIGPGATPHDAHTLEESLAARRAHHPRFATTTATLFLPWRPASLTHGEKRFPLSAAVTFHVGPPNADLPLGAGCPALGIALLQDRWRLTVDRQVRTEVKINGIACTSAQLRAGDVIEPMPGVELHFNA
jgi:uncharacterized protein (TIGR02996 family)